MATEDAEWLQLRDEWMAEFQPDTPSFTQYVVRAAQAELTLRQEQRRFDDANNTWMRGSEDVSAWDAKQNKRYREMKWRLADAERTALRWSGVIERMRRTRVLDNAKLGRARANETAAPANPLVAADAFPNPPYLQEIEVQVLDGVTTTTFKPANRNVLMALKNHGLPNQVVQRVLQLPPDLPPEYEWARASDGRAPEKLEWRMKEQDFIDDVEKEKEAGTGHVLDSRHIPVREVVLR